MQTGYMYLIAIIDLHSRYVLKWSISNTMTADWCSHVLQETLEKYPNPIIFNTDRTGVNLQPMYLQHRC